MFYSNVNGFIISFIIVNGKAEIDVQVFSHNHKRSAQCFSPAQLGIFTAPINHRRPERPAGSRMLGFGQ
jgi:hypothetical protein